MVEGATDRARAPRGWFAIKRRSLLLRSLAAANVVIRRRDPLELEGDVPPDVRDLLRRARRGTDISDHLPTLYAEAVAQAPRLIVELGTRGGASTDVLVRAAERCGARMVSIDLEDCADVVASDRWSFVRADDVQFASAFPAWAAAQGLPTEVDLLFVDTSHLYEHTRAEIRAWFPLLAADARAIFHDTNLRTFYRRRDRTIGHGWDNERGVIRAIEEHLGVRIDERRYVAAVVGGWALRHHPECCGLTILQRLRAPDRPA